MGQCGAQLRTIVALPAFGFHVLPRQPPIAAVEVALDRVPLCFQAEAALALLVG
jgi:hypothetical protein